MARPAMPADLTTAPARAEDLPEISRLHGRCFGPGRFARTAYRVREGAPDISPYCAVARSSGVLLAAIRYTEIRIGDRGGALLLGPLAVDQGFAGAGIGVRLIRESMASALAAGESFVLLVGDMSYYGRFGFKPAPAGQITLPGPVDPARLLGCDLVEGDMTTRRGPVVAARRRNEDGVR